MKYTKKQHMLSQWVLRNFRSDDTATQPKDKQRVWCHTVYNSPEQENDIKEIPLPISSIAICKDCFMLTDGESGENFDIENELSHYERDTAILFNDLIHGHEFHKLLDVSRMGNSLKKIVNFMVIQLFLGFLNPQNKMDGKDEVLKLILGDLVERYHSIRKLLHQPPSNVKRYYNHGIFKKMLKVTNSSSDIDQKCKTLFYLSMLAEAQNLPSPFGHLSRFRKEMFSQIYISGIYHTGYDFESTDIRPVFTITPTVVSLNPKTNFNLLPLAHNLALSFSLEESRYYNSYLDVYSVNPNKLRCRSSKKIRIFKVSHDFMDGIAGWIPAINANTTNTLYTPYELKDIELYLEHQKKNYEHHYTPDKPMFVII
jgi:hypothetical protein